MKVIPVDEYSLEIKEEKHTLLNLIRWSILTFEHHVDVELVGYSIPHPMEDTAIMKIQLKDEKLQSKKEIVNVLLRGVENARKVVERCAQHIT
ncbi:DNA-directed RNA polymerases I and III subunit RPAC2 [Nematocida sp. LUAm3]|nr:DNA-directed RNA polymerases I and III subunit RPAC2 [Nematocida sp. LUAm3]KAI5174821.1 DNA-directed RNA polymerases I and III subunit RPAC2 [Nematocida sp. LUAm2]KAI5177424.1 DNA-directed RNA polymerases I and III subunit RPAC2 [Nematocida sp. LUAm1]